MTVFLAEPLSGSEIVIGEISKSTRLEVQEENRLIKQVWQRTALLKIKRSNFTPAEYRIKLQGEHALETLIESHTNEICALVLKYQPNGGSASEDLKQEAISAFVESIDTFDPSFGTRLYTYAFLPIKARLQNATGKDTRNQIASAKALFETEACETLEIADSYEIEQLNEAIAQLTETEQQVIQLRNQDIPFAEIAQTFERSVKRIQNLYYEARRRLKLLLGLTIAPVEQKPETIEPIAVEATVQKDFGKKRVLFQALLITNQNRSVQQDRQPTWLRLASSSFNNSLEVFVKISQFAFPICAAATIGLVSTVPALAWLVSFPVAGYALYTLDKHKQKIPKSIFNLSTIAVYCAFLSIRMIDSAHALVLNRISAKTKEAITAFGVTGMDKVPDWITYSFLLFLLVAVGGIVVGWFKNRQGDDEENMRVMNKVVGIVVKLLVGDFVLSLIGV